MPVLWGWGSFEDEALRSFRGLACEVRLVFPHVNYVAFFGDGDFADAVAFFEGGGEEGLQVGKGGPFGWVGDGVERRDEAHLSSEFGGEKARVPLQHGEGLPDGAGQSGYVSPGFHARSGKSVSAC